MKQVTKETSPPIFETWKGLSNENWQPTYDDLKNPEKRAVHESLLEEQGGVCCYCGRAIDQSDSHIEHFRPQNGYDHLALSYDNLHASCIRQTEPGSPLHCGHAKDDDFEEDQVISPTDAQCEARFDYTMLGQITSHDPEDTKAEYMVGLLKLDIPFLQNRRREVVTQVFDPQFLEAVTADELRLLRDSFRRRDAQAKGRSFGHVLARFAEQRLADFGL